MSRYLSVKSFSLLALLLLLVALAGLGQSFHLFQRGAFNIQEWIQSDTLKKGSLWLPNYRVVVEAQPIGDLENMSALTFDPDRNSLFTVINQPSQIVELTLEGQIKRIIPLIGFGDTEAIEYISSGIYIVTDERQQRLIKIRLDDNTRVVDAADSQQLSLSLGESGNKGFEGLAYDPIQKRLFVAKERDPVQIFQVMGFPYVEDDKPLSVSVTGDLHRDSRLFVRDLSSLQFDQHTGHLLALSDESRLVVELDTQGKPISTMSLLKGMHGLHRSVPQAEGIAMDDLGTLYLVSEPNLFYIFKKRN